MALAVGAISEAADSLEEAAAGADAVVLAAPVPRIAEPGPAGARRLGAGCVVTDLGSTK